MPNRGMSLFQYLYVFMYIFIYVCMLVCMCVCIHLSLGWYLVSRHANPRCSFDIHPL